jgi:hypothetical protein
MKYLRMNSLSFRIFLIVCITVTPLLGLILFHAYTDQMGIETPVRLDWVVIGLVLGLGFLAGRVGAGWLGELAAWSASIWDS